MLNYFRLLLLAVSVCVFFNVESSAALFESALSESVLSEEWAVEKDSLKDSLEDPLFSADTDLYLGQRNRRSGGGGRIWGNFYYGATTLKPKDAGYKIKPDFYGVQFGFDVVRSHGIYATFFANFNKSDTDIGRSAKGKVMNYYFGFGKFMHMKGCHFGYIAAFGYDEYKVNDRISGQSGKGDGLQTSLFGEFGVDFLLGVIDFKPFYALQYDYLYHGRIGEKDAVFQRDKDGHSFVQLMGLRLNWEVADEVKFQLRTVWVHEMLNNPPPYYNYRFSAVQGTSTPAIYYFEGNTGRDWVWLGLGVKLEYVYNLKLFLDYDAMINGRHMTHFGNLGLCLNW